MIRASCASRSSNSEKKEMLGVFGARREGISATLSALIPAFCLSFVACRTDGARRKWLNGFHRYFCAASMPIRPYLDGQKFDPETIRVMGIAFEMALVALRLADRGDLANEVVARQIINLAKAGERDPERLCEAMMKEFRAPPQV